jgi:cellobiose-specific phosphotransferase system component IIC
MNAQRLLGYGLITLGIVTFLVPFLWFVGVFCPAWSAGQGEGTAEVWEYNPMEHTDD